MKDELINGIYDMLRAQEISEADFLSGLLDRLPDSWLKTELNYLVRDKKTLNTHRSNKLHKHPWRTYGQFKNGGSL